eukprot:1990967-Amphidinium_carterae.1
MEGNPKKQTDKHHSNLKHLLVPATAYSHGFGYWMWFDLPNACESIGFQKLLLRERNGARKVRRDLARPSEGTQSLWLAPHVQMLQTETSMERFVCYLLRLLSLSCDHLEKTTLPIASFKHASLAAALHTTLSSGQDASFFT